jgi:endonuclease IV
MSAGIFISKNSHIFEKTKHKNYTIAVKTEVELLKMTAFSVFLLGPLDKKKISMDYTTIAKYSKDNNIEIWPHASYISSGIWSVTNVNRHENKPLMFIRDIKDHLVIGKQLGAKGVVFHLPRHPINTVLETMEIISDCKAINSIRRNDGVLPAFTIEMPASKPNDELTYETAEKLNVLVAALVNNTKITLDWNLCVDTCHMYAGGVNFNTDFDDWERKLSTVTRDKIKLVHLNGASGKNFGTGKDGHIIPLSKQDDIWGGLISEEFRDYLARTELDEITDMNLYDKLSSDEVDAIKSSQFNSIIQFCKTKKIAMIMEINRGSLKDAKLAMDVVNHLLL